MKIVSYGDTEFKIEWLQLLKHDPVHSGISVEKRIIGNRTICNRLPQNMAEVLNDDGYNSKYDVTYVIFYSIFRLPGSTLKGGIMVNYDYNY